MHAAPGFELNASTVASPVFYERTVPAPVEVQWGQMSVVGAERRLFAAALADRHVARMVLLSESCVPLRSFRRVLLLALAVALRVVARVCACAEAERLRSYVKQYLLGSDKSFLDSFLDVQVRSSLSLPFTYHTPN